MTSSTCDDFETAKQWAIDFMGEGGPALFFLAPNRFVSASKVDHSLSITLDTDQSFGMALGPTPQINSSWRRFFVDETFVGPTFTSWREVDCWFFYSINTSSWSGSQGAELLRDEDEVADLLERDAPQSSVWPGHEGILGWYGIRDEAGRLASIGALVQWESGLPVVSSVATIREHRGEGLAQRVTGAIVTVAKEFAFDWLGLGVHSQNLVAQRAYEKVGFELRSRFRVFEADKDP